MQHALMPILSILLVAASLLACGKNQRWVGIDGRTHGATQQTGDASTVPTSTFTAEPRPNVDEMLPPVHAAAPPVAPSAGSSQSLQPMP